MAVRRALHACLKGEWKCKGEGGGLRLFYNRSLGTLALDLNFFEQECIGGFGPLSSSHVPLHSALSLHLEGKLFNISVQL